MTFNFSISLRQPLKGKNLRPNLKYICPFLVYVLSKVGPSRVCTYTSVYPSKVRLSIVSPCKVSLSIIVPLALANLIFF